MHPRAEAKDTKIKIQGDLHGIKVVLEEAIIEGSIWVSSTKRKMNKNQNGLTLIPRKIPVISLVELSPMKS